MSDTNNTNVASDSINKPATHTVVMKYNGRDGDVGYTNGEVYSLNKWEEDGMTYLSREDGSGQVAYDSMESVLQNWEFASK